MSTVQITPSENQIVPSAEQAAIAAIAAMPASQVLALLAEMQAKAKAEAEAAMAKEQAEFDLTFNDANEMLRDFSPTLLRGGRSLQLVFVPAIAAKYGPVTVDGSELAETEPAIPAHYQIQILQARAKRNVVRPIEVNGYGVAARTQSVDFGVKPPVTVDGVEYRNYREAWDKMHRLDTPNYSFNARTELIKFGHQVGIPTR